MTSEPFTTGQIKITPEEAHIKVCKQICMGCGRERDSIRHGVEVVRFIPRCGQCHLGDVRKC